MLTVGQYLLSTEVLLLHRPHALLILLLLFSHLSLLHLHCALIHDLLSLASVHTLEVVRLDTVWCKHGLLCLRVLSHEVMGVCVSNISCRLKLLVFGLRSISVALLLSELHVRILDGLLHSNSLLSMLVLSICQQSIEVELLLIVHSLGVFLLLLEELLLADLLVNPVLLL